MNKWYTEAERKSFLELAVPNLAPTLITKYHRWLHREALLRTIIRIETSDATRVIPRFEPAYSIGGKYWKAEHIRKLFALYGDWAACSVGPTQIMFPTACEMGNRLDPVELHRDWRSCLYYTIKLLNNRILRKRKKGKWVQNARTIVEIGDGYNSGNPRDSIIPLKYTKKFAAAYLSLDGAK